ncbi:MAG: hypothetical protein EOP66_07570 [Sphingomonas sp.]|jgi:hypothetical protein|nr:MAG: hypothetical protein EOP66_07570 [Sphingomonas sp.]
MTTDVANTRYRDPATKRYNRRMIGAMLSYIVLLFGVQRAFDLDAMHGPARWVLAALPGLPVAAVFWLIGDMILDMRDEYLRLLEVRKAMIATGVTMTLVSILGFLEMLGGAPHLPLFYVPVLWFGSLGIGQCANMLIERQRS